MKVNGKYIELNFFHLETIYLKNQIFKFDKYLIIFLFYCGFIKKHKFKQKKIFFLNSF